MTAQAYEVVTKGRLTPAVVGGLVGFGLVRVRDGKTYLAGTASSQEDLFRTLEVLRDLNVALISIEAVSSD
jgi:hypothetical protein